MSYVITAPELMTSAAGDLATIASDPRAGIAGVVTIENRPESGVGLPLSDQP